MSAIQTLPFEPDQAPAENTADYEEQVGRLYIGSDSYGLWRLVKWTAVAQVTGALAGVAIVGTGGTFAATAVAGANAAAATLLGATHPDLTGPVAQNAYLLLQCQDQAVVNGDAGVDVVAGNAVGTDAAGLMDAAATTVIATVVNDQTGLDLVRSPDSVRVEFDVKLYVPGV